MQDLAQAVLLSKSGLSRLVDRMEEAGLVSRRPCEEDGRGFYVDLTDAGIARLHEAAPVHVRGIIEHFTQLLEQEEAAVLAASLDRIASAANPASRELPTP
jgi:DNA-binding MarR family transcriptional regulator